MIEAEDIIDLMKYYSIDYNKKLSCSECGGKGGFKKPYPYDFENWKCTDCNGTGKDKNSLSFIEALKILVRNKKD